MIFYRYLRLDLNYNHTESQVLETSSDCGKYQAHMTVDFSQTDFFQKYNKYLFLPSLRLAGWDELLTISSFV